MGWLWILWEISVNCIENVLFIFLLIRQLGYSPEKKKYTFICFAGLVVIETLLNFNEVPDIPTVLSLLSCYIVSSVFVFQGSLPKRLLWGCSGAVIAQFCNIITINLFTIFGTINLLEGRAQTETRFEMMICYILLYALFYFILANTNPKSKIFLKWPLRIVVIAIFVVGIWAIQLIIDIYVDLSSVHEGSEISLIDDNLIAVSVIIIGTFLGILFLFEYVGSLAQKNIDAQAELQRTKWENAQFKHVSDTYQALRSWKHDFKNHLALIQTYLTENKTEELKQYIAEITEETGPFMHLYYTGHSVIDAILSNKLFIASSMGIRIKSNVVLPEKLNITDSQLCSILSNLLDNAIEAQKDVSDPFIHISIQQERGMLYIKIENSSKGYYRYKNNQLVSVKDSSDHGIGLQQVRRIVENLHGIISIDPKPANFLVKILIPIDIEGVNIA